MKESDSLFRIDGKYLIVMCYDTVEAKYLVKAETYAEAIQVIMKDFTKEYRFGLDNDNEITFKRELYEVL